MNESGQYFLGPECVMWIRYQASQSLAGINETTGTSQIMPGAPAAIDGTAALMGSIGMTSFVPQQNVSDRDLLCVPEPRQRAFVCYYWICLLTKSPRPGLGPKVQHWRRKSLAAL